MRQYVSILSLIALTIAAPGTARAIELFDRVIEFAEDTFDSTLHKVQRDPNGPPSLRIALLLPRSGRLREAGDRIARGWRIAAGIADGYIAGRPLELILINTSRGTEATIRRAREVGEEFPIDIYAGVIGAKTAADLAAYTDKIGKPLILAGAVGEKVMSGLCKPHVVRTSFNIGPYQTTSGRFIAEKFRTLVTLAPDSRAGHDLIRRFTKAYRKNGGRIVEQIWAPAARKYDWSALLSRATLGGPAAIYTFLEGRNAERAVHQYSRSGVKLNAGLIGPEWLFGPRVMNRRGKHADGLRFLSAYFPGLDAAGNRTFVDEYRKAYWEDPDVYAYMGYENALATLLTAADLDGQIHDGAAFVSAMKKVQFVSFMPRGEYGLNETNSAFLTRMFWVEVVHGEAGTRLKRLGSIPIDPDISACKQETATFLQGSN